VGLAPAVSDGKLGGGSEQTQLEIGFVRESHLADGMTFGPKFATRKRWCSSFTNNGTPEES
jgi:hypothetical protein